MICLLVAESLVAECAEEMLDCCAPLEMIKENGITFDEFACLAKCNGLAAKVITPRNPYASCDLFRAHVKSATSAGNMVLVTSFRYTSVFTLCQLV